MGDLGGVANTGSDDGTNEGNDSSSNSAPNTGADDGTNDGTDTSCANEATDASALSFLLHSPGVQFLFVLFFIDVSRWDDLMCDLIGSPEEAQVYRHRADPTTYGWEWAVRSGGRAFGHPCQPWTVEA